MEKAQKNVTAQAGTFLFERCRLSAAPLMALLVCLWLVGCGEEVDDNWDTETTAYAVEVNALRARSVDEAPAGECGGDWVLVRWEQRRKLGDSGIRYGETYEDIDQRAYGGQTSVLRVPAQSNDHHDQF